MAVVYLHKKKNTNEVFYVGVGKNKYRAKSKSGRNQYWENVVDKYGYDIEIIYDNITMEDALEKEKELIKKYGRNSLTNLTDGGEFYSFWENRKFSKDHRKKISESLKGRTFSKKHKANLSKSLSGKPKSKEHIEKMKNRVISDDTRKKMREGHLGQENWNKGGNVSDEVRKKISNTLKGNTNAKTKTVFQYDMEGNLIRKWDKMVDIKNELGFSMGNISSCINGKRKNSNGFIWKCE